MKEGPDGFQVAVWPDGSQSGTEVPNILMHSAKPQAKSKAKGKAAMKKPAARQVEALQVDPENDGSEPKLYCKMFYKNSNGFGIRQLFGGKKQVISLCRKSASKVDLENIADRALERLHGGGDEEDVKIWVGEKMKQL